jgi:glucose-1-phosphate thymidylyltransferase
VLEKGVIVVPPTARSLGPWLDATRATPLQRVANRPIVCHVLDSLKAGGVTATAIVMPADVAEEISASIEADGPSGIGVEYLVTEVDGAELSDTLRTAAEFVGDSPCILHRADGILGQPLRPFAEQLQGDSDDVLLLVEQDPRSARRLKIVSPPTTDPGELDPAAPEHCTAGVCLLGGRMLRESLASDWRARDLDFTAVAHPLARDGRQVRTHGVRGWRHFSGDTLDLLDMNRTMLDLLEPNLATIEEDGNRFEGCVVIDPTASVESSVIVGPVIIGAEAMITDSYIGPHTAIGERARIEGAEIERSIVLAGASILHVGGRLVASVVGREARIFRDFSMPRALRLQVGDGDEVALC